MVKRMPMPTKPFYRYDLKVEIPATEVAIVIDALDGEKLSLRDRLGNDELRRQLEEQEIHIDVRSDESLPDFQRDIETISTYLSELISGREFYVEPRPEKPLKPLLKGWVILGRRGETERMALDLDWDSDAQMVIDRGIDKSEARRRWNELPEWVRASISMRHTASSALRGTARADMKD